MSLTLSLHPSFLTGVRCVVLDIVDHIISVQRYMIVKITQHAFVPVRACLGLP